MIFTFALFGFAFLFGFLFWHYAIQIFLIWTIFEGAVRKWLLPSSQNLIFFVGPVLLAGAYMRYFGDRIQRREIIRINHALTMVLIFYFVYAVVQAFNDALQTPIMGFIAVIVHFMFVPMAYMVPDVFGTIKRFSHFMFPYVFVALPLAILASVQLFSPALSPINAVVAADLPVLGGINEMGFRYVRVSATFGTYNGYAQFLVIMVTVTLALLGQERYARWRWQLILVLVVSLVSSLMTATRGNILVAWASLPLFTIASIVLGRKHARHYWRVFIVVTILLAGILIFTRPGTAAWETVTSRATTANDTVSRFLLPWSPWRVWKYSGFAGNGIGITYGGSWSLGTKPTFPVQVHYEPERMLYELGPVGFFLVYLVRFVVMGMILRLLRRCQNWEHRLLLLVTFVVHIPVLYLGQMTYQHTYSRWWWLMVGIVFLIEKEMKNTRSTDFRSPKTFSLDRSISVLPKDMKKKSPLSTERK